MTTDAVGGVWTYATDLARGLAARGVVTHLALLGPSPSAAQAAQAATIPGLTLHDTGLPLDWMAGTPDAIRTAGVAIRNLAATLGVDLVHLNSPALASAGGFGVPVLSACHSCLATWWAAVRGGPMPAAFAWRSALLREGYLACDALVAPSRAFASATAEAHALPSSPVAIHNGRDAPDCVHTAAMDAVFTAGRLWDAGKNIAALDRVAAHLPFPVLAAGPLEGPERSRVSFAHLTSLGSLDDAGMAAIWRGTPLYAAPALYEPFGLAVLEAAQAGCALVLADIPSFRELWSDAALFVDWSDSHAVAGAIRALMGDAAERARLGAAARDRAARYGLDAMAEATLAQYEGLLAGGRREASAA
ncbi:glycosyltransferase family 4 protein [Roseomonas arctica]|uniref:Glycosyltransferase family 4 protein n=2 Tax=Plastoroseomonas arctica TaxID=1509237 RepID=A0AAF1KRD2_9PROT|nr:glycosyltransferase family 4 protein [Plastoroseomonas arctica]MBR0654177.1 glycosyltransferase family 4 protein [Plastoroseomonas arctica]